MRIFYYSTQKNQQYFYVRGKYSISFKNSKDLGRWYIPAVSLFRRPQQKNYKFETSFANQARQMFQVGLALRSCHWNLEKMVQVL